MTATSNCLSAHAAAQMPMHTTSNSRQIWNTRHAVSKAICSTRFSSRGGSMVCVNVCLSKHHCFRQALERANCRLWRHLLHDLVP